MKPISGLFALAILAGCASKSGATLTRSLTAALVGTIAILLGSAPSSAQKAYITNSSDNTVSVIATATNTVVGLPIPIGSEPSGVAVAPDGSKVYVTNFGDNTVSVIDIATNTVTATIPVPRCPFATSGLGAVGVAVTSDGNQAYVANVCSGAVSVIDTATNTVTATIPGIGAAFGIAVTPDASRSTSRASEATQQ